MGVLEGGLGRRDIKQQKSLSIAMVGINALVSLLIHVITWVKILHTYLRSLCYLSVRVLIKLFFQCLFMFFPWIISIWSFPYRVKFFTLLLCELEGVSQTSYLVSLPRWGRRRRSKSDRLCGMIWSLIVRSRISPCILSMLPLHSFIPDMYVIFTLSWTLQGTSAAFAYTNLLTQYTRQYRVRVTDWRWYITAPNHYILIQYIYFAHSWFILSHILLMGSCQVENMATR